MKITVLSKVCCYKRLSLSEVSFQPFNNPLNFLIFYALQFCLSPIGRLHLIVMSVTCAMITVNFHEIDVQQFLNPLCIFEENRLNKYMNTVLVYRCNLRRYSLLIIYLPTTVIGITYSQKQQHILMITLTQSLNRNYQFKCIVHV